MRRGLLLSVQRQYIIFPPKKETPTAIAKRNIVIFIMFSLSFLYFLYKKNNKSTLSTHKIRIVAT